MEMRKTAVFTVNVYFVFVYQVVFYEAEWGQKVGVRVGRTVEELFVFPKRILRKFPQGRIKRIRYLRQFVSPDLS